jgi:hypothetical protein
MFPAATKKELSAEVSAHIGISYIGTVACEVLPFAAGQHCGMMHRINTEDKNAVGYNNNPHRHKIWTPEGAMLILVFGYCRLRT